MLVEFKTNDGLTWVVDFQQLTWARVSKSATEKDSEVLESGVLDPKGYGVYGLTGRTLKSVPPLCTVGIMSVPMGQTVTIYLRANKEAGTIHDFTLPVPIKEVLYEVLKAG